MCIDCVFSNFENNFESFYGIDQLVQRKREEQWSWNSICHLANDDAVSRHHRPRPMWKEFFSLCGLLTARRRNIMNRIWRWKLL